MSIKEISFQQIQVFYRSEGKGHPVLLLHGFGEDGRIWEGLCGYLPAHYHWLIPDIPGSGRSPALPGNPAIEDWAAVGKAICEAEQIDRCTVLGHSMGGYIALAMTELYPTMVNGLGLVHSTAFPDSEAKKEARSKSIAFIEAHGAMAFLRTSIPGLFSPGYAAANPSTVEELVENGHSFTPTALIQYYKAMIHRPDRAAVLQNADVPILVLAGEQDMAVPFAQSQQQAYLAKETHVQYLRHSAHLGMLEEPDRFHEAISQFLADVHREK